MSRPPADPADRLAKLRPVLAELKPGEKVNAETMARIAKMTWANLKLIIDADPELPVSSRGGMGVAWSFDAHAVVAHLVRRAEEKMAARSGIANRVQQLMGLDSAPGPAEASPPTMTPLQIKQVTDAMMTMDKMKALRGELLPLAQAADLLNDIMSTFQAEALAFAGRHDPTGKLDPATRKAIDDYVRALLVRLHDKVMAVIDKPGAKRAA